MRVEVTGVARRPDGGVEAETIYLLTDREVAQLRRTGLAKPAPDRNVLTRVHHVLNAARAATRGQRIIRDAAGRRLHRSGLWLPPEIEDDDPTLYQYHEAGPRLSRWQRGVGAGVEFIEAYPFVPTKGADDDLPEYLDPQWARETFVRDQDAEIERIAAWKARLIDAQLTRGDAIRPRQRTTLNLQVGASGDDGRYSMDEGTGTAYTSGVAQGRVGHNTISIDIAATWAFFTGVSGLSGATIDAAVYSLIAGGISDQGTPLTKIHAHDTETPAAPTDLTEALAIENSGLTTAGVDWDSPGLTQSAFTESPSIVSVIQELADSFDPAEIQIMHIDDGSDTGGANTIRPGQYDNDTAEGALLDIDYTASGATGTGASTVALPTTAATGAMQPEGSGASALFLPTAAGTGEQPYEATGASTLFLPTAAGTGAMQPEGTGASTLFLPTTSGDGHQPVTGTGASTVQFPTTTGQGSIPVTGTGASTLPFPTTAGISTALDGYYYGTQAADPEYSYATPGSGSEYSYPVQPAAQSRSYGVQEAAQSRSYGVQPASPDYTYDRDGAMP